MCGRFTLTPDPADLMEAFPGFTFPADLTPRYNIAPSQLVAAIPNNGQNKADLFHWGLIPSWAKDPTIGNRMINARAESLAEKPSFRTAYRRRRCLVIANGYYEWRPEPNKKSKTPFYIKLKSEKPFAFAGLWETWRSAESAADDTTIMSCTIITTTPNPLLEPIHNRMPVILESEVYDQWLDPTDQSPDKLSLLLKSYPDSKMTAYPVSTLVNNPKNDSPECIVPATS